MPPPDWGASLLQSFRPIIFDARWCLADIVLKMEKKIEGRVKMLNRNFKTQKNADFFVVSFCRRLPTAQIRILASSWINFWGETFEPNLFGKKIPSKAPWRNWRSVVNRTPPVSGLMSTTKFSDFSFFQKVRIFSPKIEKWQVFPKENWVTLS